MSPLLRSRPRPRPRPAARLDDDAVRATWQVASLLIDYPDEDQRLDLVEAVLPGLPDELREPLARFVAHRRTAPLGELQAEYVETFDTRRRCALFLTYFLHGDTRKRGMALLRFKQTYMAAGLELGDRELPDHLAVVLEFGASADLDAARRLLLDHRAGLELLRLSLTDLGSPWADVVVPVCATLPPLDGEGMELVRRIAEQGPPDEEVGMTPYGTPGFDAALTDPTYRRPGASGSVDLGLPTFPGRHSPSHLEGQGA
ncbi:nitrate reductase molybdenum cofactor assembly chaperone [Nocardioides solisilvae]|uniref:nitrate reductase molybdenum cofactor assembly chaperone n=1 Tax=Nocardioides solisilvae TaxID=1542435 RepID=UPI000D742D97|nr:nitrate reductase molybdenum cofactor assembly chaperone [Nocardioides solisilvae]